MSSCANPPVRRSPTLPLWVSVLCGLAAAGQWFIGTQTPTRTTLAALAALAALLIGVVGAAPHRTAARSATSVLAVVGSGACAVLALTYW